MPETIPPWVVFIDTETVDVGDGWQRLLLGCYEVWKVNRRGIPNARGHNRKGGLAPFQRGIFTDLDRIYGLLRSLGAARAVAHNWQYDASVIKLGAPSTRRRYGYSIDMETGTSFPIDKGYAPFSVQVSWGGESFTHFLDNTNFHKTSLANLGESFGISKLPMPVLEPGMLQLLPVLDLRCMESLDSKAMEHWTEEGPAQPVVDVVRYCKRDVEVLRESWFSLFRFSDEVAGVTPGQTVASMAKRCYQRRWLPSFHKVPGEQFIGSLAVPAAAEAEEKAFHGGRADVFWTGRVPGDAVLRKYDVNSMYPSCMLGHMPVQLLGPASNAELINALDVYGGGDGGAKLFLADVSVKIPRTGLGWLGWEGVKLQKRGLVFPSGRFRCWAWQPMLDIAHKMGWIKQCHNVLSYRARSIFKAYVEDVYAMRKEAKAAGDAPRSLLLKYLLNSLYGKFGQRNFGSWERVTDQRELDWQTMHRQAMDTPDVCRWQEYPYGVMDSDTGLKDYLETEEGIYGYEPAEDGMGPNSIASVAGYITAKARSVLWWAMASLKEDGHNIFMCDTDALITDGVMPAAMVGSELGQWELEEESAAADVEFMAPKHYTFNLKSKIKGVREPKMGETVYRQAKFSRWQSTFLSRDAKRAATIERGARVEDIEKVVLGNNLKRTRIGDNMANEPLDLDESPPSP